MCEGVEMNFLSFFPVNLDIAIRVAAHLFLQSGDHFVFACVTAQRQIGETAMNEASSRSHQILRLVCAHIKLNCLQQTFFVKKKPVLNLLC